MRKNYLLTPGPTPIPESVNADMHQPIIHHRTPQFEKLLEEVRQGLKYLFQTRQDVLVLAATGTGAMDAAISNLFSSGDRVIVINAGKFGERWGEISKAYGLVPIEITLQPGDSINPQDLSDAIRNHPNARAILFQASETSTGTLMPTREICALAKKAGMLSICDGITACGVVSLPMDEWDIDVLITGAQKALMTPPGLSMIALSERAWQAHATATLPRFYFDLARERKMQNKNQTAWTPAISLVKGLHRSLRMIQEEGLENVFKRHELLARATRAAVQALGLEIFAAKSPAPSVTAVKIPEGIRDGKHIPRIMEEKYGVTIVGGQEELAGKIIRLSHIGYCDRFDIITAISALELTLNDLGYRVNFGKGVGAALEVFATYR